MRIGARAFAADDSRLSGVRTSRCFAGEEPIPKNGRSNLFLNSVLPGAVRYHAADDCCGHGDVFDLMGSYLVWIGFEDHDVSQLTLRQSSFQLLFEGEVGAVQRHGPQSAVHRYRLLDSQHLAAAGTAAHCCADRKERAYRGHGTIVVQAEPYPPPQGRCEGIYAGGPLGSEEHLPVPVP